MVPRDPRGMEPNAWIPRPRLRIAIDMDEVMADALAEHLRRYNAAFGTTLAPADLHGCHLEDWIVPAQREAVDAMLDASFFEDLAVMPGCLAAVRELAAVHEVVVVSAAMDVPCSFAAKFRWLQRHFPFIPPSRIVFCGDKSLIDADYLIDDRARHFERFKGQPLLFSAPHNSGESRYPRMDSWRDVREFFARLERRPGPLRFDQDGWHVVVPYRRPGREDELRDEQLQFFECLFSIRWILRRAVPIHSQFPPKNRRRALSGRHTCCSGSRALKNNSEDS